MQFRDLKKQYEVLKLEIDAGIQATIESSAFILGKTVEELEEKLADYTGRKHCITCASGTDALVLALKAYNIGVGDAVFVPDFTYIASASCASLVGATPIFVDIDINTFNINPTALENAIEKTLKEGKLTAKAIIPVDLFGQPANFDKINRIAKKYGLLILEDAAQGFGGNIRGKRAGSFGDISATSFFPAKPLGCYGDGGAIFSDDDEIDTRLRSLRAGGRSPEDKYNNCEIGINSRLDTMQAAVLLAKFDTFVNKEIDAVNEVARWYTDRLKEIVETPVVLDGFISSWAQYTIKLSNREQRNNMQTKLKEAGIPSMIYYPRGMHQQQAFKDMKLTDDSYPNTARAVDTVLSLPMHPYLDEATVDMICSEIRKILK